VWPGAVESQVGSSTSSRPRLPLDSRWLSESDANDAVLRRHGQRRRPGCRRCRRQRPGRSWHRRGPSLFCH